MAIKAHLDSPESCSAPGDSQRGASRSAQRRALWLETSGFGPDGGTANVTIHNISANGLLLETALELATGEQLALDLPEAGAVTATIIWRSEGLFGCAFERPIGPAALAAVQLQGVAVAPSSAPAPAAAVTDVRPSDPLGVTLNRLRREAGLTLADVANRLGVSKPTVWAWEKGKARPLPERIDAIAAALGVAPEALAESRGAHEAISGVVDDCRQRIAAAYGTPPNTVRIFVEL
jgi:transcriptional regulator with XRE-family HTH domain